MGKERKMKKLIAWIKRIFRKPPEPYLDPEFWKPASEIDFSEVREIGFLYGGCALMVPIGDTFCNKCDGTGFKPMWRLEILWHSFWQKTPIENCREYKMCKCMYYIKVTE